MKYKVLAVVMAVLLISCAGERPGQARLVHANIRDAVPRAEPLSKRGNPDSYVQSGRRYFVLPTARGYRQRGIASWYGKKFHGRETSNGERYNMYAMTAAHKTLPLPSYVRVTNLQNGRSVIVRVNDRGPFVDDRIIDLSYSAAHKIDMIRGGTAKVEVVVVYPGDVQANPVLPIQADLINNLPAEQIVASAATPPIREVESRYKDAVDWRDETHLKNRIYIQIGAYTLRPNAEKVVHQLVAANFVGVKIFNPVNQASPLHRVRIGPLDSVAATDDAVLQLQNLGFADYQIVIE